jgi:hypothetical protein
VKADVEARLRIDSPGFLEKFNRESSDQVAT